MIALTRRRLTALALAAALGPGGVLAQAGRNAVTVGLVLEPAPGLDPTSAAAAAIGEVVHYNVLEGLTKINADGSVTPLLAERWSMDPDGRSWTFVLRKGVRFHDGEAFDASDVKFTFERAKAEGSTNKARKAVFDNIGAIATPDPSTVIVTLNKPDASFPFRMGENTAVILDPKSAATTATKPVGTGPYRFDDWRKGSAITLVKWDGYRDPKAATIQRATFRVISDPAAQVAALLAGDVDTFPRGIGNQAVRQLQADPRFTVAIGSTAGKGVLALNNRRKPFDDPRVRRALQHAIDRQAFIEGVLEGYGTPIGSHFAPSDAGYVDLTGVAPYDVEKAKALLKEAGVALPLNVTLTLPPPPYARKGGEVVAAMLAKVGVVAKIENVEWAQWLGGAFKGQFDMTIVNHVEPLDYAQYANPQYYWGYDSAAYRGLVDRLAATAGAKDRQKLFAELQRKLADDAPNVFLFNPQNVAVSKKALKGVWANSPIFANDLAAWRWQ